jgi:hypothetical protein
MSQAAVPLIVFDTANQNLILPDLYIAGFVFVVTDINCDLTGTKIETLVPGQTLHVHLKAAHGHEAPRICLVALPVDSLHEHVAYHTRGFAVVPYAVIVVRPSNMPNAQTAKPTVAQLDSISDDKVYGFSVDSTDGQENRTVVGSGHARVGRRFHGASGAEQNDAEDNESFKARWHRSYLQSPSNTNPPQK